MKKQEIQKVFAEELAIERYGNDRYTEEYFLDLSEVKRDAFIEGYLRAKEEGVIRRALKFIKWFCIELIETSKNAPKETHF